MQYKNPKKRIKLKLIKTKIRNRLIKLLIIVMINKLFRIYKTINHKQHIFIKNMKLFLKRIMNLIKN
jgi:hypothetical protein